MNGNYNFGGASNGNSRGYAPTLRVAPFVQAEMELDRLFKSSSDFGESIAVTSNNFALRDGILTLGKSKNGKPVYKLFSLQDAPVRLGEGFTAEDVPEIITAGRNNDQYDVIAVRVLGDEEAGYETSAHIHALYGEGTSPVLDEAAISEARAEYEALGDTVPIPLTVLGLTDDNGDPEDRVTIWESSNKTGPTASAKATAKVLTDRGAAAVVDDSAKFGWLAEGVSLRPELAGMRIIYAREEKASNQSEYNFERPIFVDLATGEQILPDNDAQGGEQEAPTAATDGGATAAQEPADGGDDDALAEFYKTVEEYGLTAEKAVLGLLDDMVADPRQPGMTEESVDREQIVADLCQ